MAAARFARIRGSSWRRFSKRELDPSAKCLARPKRRRNAKAISTSSRSAANPRCPGRPTVAAGKPPRWEAAALEKVVDWIEARPGFAPADWNDRSVVEITGKERTGAWFLHALTGDEWLLTLRFRVPKKTFDQDRLPQQLALKSLDDLDELPVYGRSDRVRVRNVKGAWQEVAVTVHWLKEIETPAFEKFLAKAADAFQDAINRKQLNPAELTPWKVLGRKWHVSRKGFPSGKRIRWEAELLERLFDLLQTAVPQAEIDWGN